MKLTYLLRGLLRNATTGCKSFDDLPNTPCPSFKDSSPTITWCITKTTRLSSRLYRMPYGIPALRGTPQSYAACRGTFARRTLPKRLGLLFNVTKVFTSQIRRH